MYCSTTPAFTYASQFYALWDHNLMGHLTIGRRSIFTVVVNSILSHLMPLLLLLLWLRLLLSAFALNTFADVQDQAIYHVWAHARGEKKKTFGINWKRTRDLKLF